MKSMTCKELGGACDLIFRAESFDEIAQMSKKHGMEMFQKQDIEHLKAMEAMQSLMQDQEAMQQWFDEKRKAYEALPND